jgi:hypothetical protein
MYLYLDIAADGSCTTGSTTLQPVYQRGGSYSTTNGQFTFNYKEMTGKVGNGSTAVQSYRVFVGEVTVAGNVVTAITWYALNGEAVVSTGQANASTVNTLNHNLGISVGAIQDVQMSLVCISAEAGWSAGDEIPIVPNYYDGVSSRYFGIGLYSSKTLNLITGSNGAIVLNKTGGATPITGTSWYFKVKVRRGW